MNKSPRRRTLAVAFMVTSIIAPILCASEQPPEPVDDWTSIVRGSPYWVSQGVYNNIVTIRRWVLKESGYCSDTDRHILFDMRGQFLGYIDDESSREATQKRLNDTRRTLATSGRAENWAVGGPAKTGYPFALACDQPHVNLDEAVARYLGTLPAELIWGAWDDLVFASQEKPEPLHDALMYVYETRQQRNNLPKSLPTYLAGQVLIESSGQQRAHSIADAKGILQLSPSALSDCQIKPANHWHRLAQIDCALRLMNQNARNLQEPFNQRFGELPAEKRDRLFTLLLVQAYHGGAGRVKALLDDDTLSRPAAYFAREHDNFSAGDIAFGMVFHNLGRDRFGLASLYYVADVQLAAEALCKTARLGDASFCKL
ncbi:MULTISPECIES: hypothetical protein [Marinobacter]|uniref:hypothetical protein n=1 Tax=Marinobacter TaxID=2742 RepID=UPI001CD9A557|nr:MULTISPECIES: hypothetical protein [Marinobacter]